MKESSMTHIEKHSFDLSGKTAFITGAAGLLGMVHAEALARHGANLFLTDLESDICRERARSIADAFGIRANAANCDVTDPGSWRTALSIAQESFGTVDILVNNAGYTTKTRSKHYNAPFEEFPLDDWNAILDVNLTGVFLGCQVIGHTMLEQKTGSIINIASLYGIVSPNHTIYENTGIVQPIAYSVSKAGVLGITRYLATLWADLGVRVNAITPGGVFDSQSETFVRNYEKQAPIRRMADRKEIGGAVVFLASDASTYCTGHNLVLDGGWTVW